MMGNGNSFFPIYVFLFELFSFPELDRAPSVTQKGHERAKSDSLVFIYIFMIFNGLHTQ